MKRLALQDLWAGLLFICFGLVGYVLASDLAVGTSAKMGPGYVPRGLSILLILFGIVIGLNALRGTGELVGELHWRPIVLVTLATSAFAGLLLTAGFIPAASVLILVALIAGNDFSWRYFITYVLGLVGVCAVIFKFLVGLPFDLIKGVW